MQITAEGKTVDKKTAFGLGLDYIQSFTCELAHLPNGLLSTYLFFPLEMGAHHGPAVSTFWVSNGSTNGLGCLRGLLKLIKTHFENISGRPF